MAEHAQLAAARVEQARRASSASSSCRRRSGRGSRRPRRRSIANEIPSTARTSRHCRRKRLARRRAQAGLALRHAEDLLEPRDLHHRHGLSFAARSQPPCVVLPMRPTPTRRRGCRPAVVSCRSCRGVPRPRPAAPRDVEFEHVSVTAYAAAVRILLVSQMYPGPDAPDLGPFVAQMERALAERGHEIERAVLDTRAGGKLRYLTLARRTLAAPRPRRRLRALPRPVRTDRRARRPGAARRHRARPRRAQHRRAARRRGGDASRRPPRPAVVCVSDYLRRELETKLPEARGKTEVVSSGVDLERFAVAPPPEGPPRFLCVGSLEERKNVVRLADAFARLRRESGEGTLTFAGDGPLRARARGPRRRRLHGRVPHAAIPAPPRREPRARPAEPARAARPGAARGDGLRAVGGRDPRRRPARVRAARGGRARRPARRRRARARARDRRGAAAPERGRARRRAPRTT